MDPLNAVSLAACVVQFTDFTIRLFSEAHDVYKSASGQTSQTVALSAVAADLSLLSEEIEKQSQNPGCGKSTLMKFILKDERLHRHLRARSKDRQIALASFYFWAAGTDMRTSQEGLLRTLLHQLLRQLRHLVPIACPRRWNLFKIFGPDALRLFPEWSWRELLEGFSILASESGKDFCIALFIDGLDEFHGNHETLVNFIQALHEHGQGDVKVCVSSRPWNVFVDAYKRNPSLQVQDLTKGDIGLFVREKFQQRQGFRELQEVFPVDAREIMDGVVEKAQGVFLWVSIVVRLLLTSLTEGDKLSALKKLLESLPDDLSQLYQGIWNRVQPQYLPNASQFFQIHKASLTTTLQATTLWFADEEFALDLDVNATLSAKKSHIVDSIKRRLNSRTKGILEVTPQDTIEYLHRTAHDWVRGIWKDVLAQSPPGFDPYLALLKASVAQYRGKRSGIAKDFWQGILGSSPHKEFWQEILGLMNYAARIDDSPASTAVLVQALDMLDATATQHGAGLAPAGRHWSSTQAVNSLDNTFIGLAAQFAVLPYVREKVLSRPQLMQSNPGTISLLENAIFDSRYFMDEPDVRLNARTQTSTITTRRLELVRFLLETNPKLDRNGLQLAKLVRERPFIMSPCVDRDGEAVDYWDAVAALLPQNERSVRSTINRPLQTPPRTGHL
ncbi:hypothetical protein B0T10DRAFT_575116 [Thelonectria olida]|uniref:NACHT domain-containing protein n=1 Tax=Thelonectria olida TaxID=1576542 RepID=A0A9P8W0A8_9HYPO|nr:hypothetical protein B0T10DRAFT_575116 [Thelonectria olida]